MFQSVNKLLKKFSSILFSETQKKERASAFLEKKAISPRGRGFSNKGQVAIVLMFVIAIALVFYAASQNLGRLNKGKLVSQVAATSGAARLGSQMASYGQVLVEETLGGSKKKCDSSGLFKTVLSLVIAVIALVLTICTYGTSSYAAAAAIVAVIGVVLAVASVVIQATVIEPSLTEMWNAIITETMSMTDSFLEMGMQKALFASVTDQGKVPDIKDLDGDRLFGFTGAVPNDEISRFSAYYDWRLRDIREADPGPVGIFIVATKEFIYKDGDDWGLYDPVRISYEPDPYAQLRAMDTNHPCLPEAAAGRWSECNPCCLPAVVTDPSDENNVLAIRDECCTQFGAAPGDCGAWGTCELASTTPISHTLYPWVYDRYFENHRNNDPASADYFLSFLEQLGRDDEIISLYGVNTEVNRDLVSIDADDSQFHPQILTPFIPTGTIPPDPTWNIKDATNYIENPDRFLSYSNSELRGGVFPTLYKLQDWGMNLLQEDVVVGTETTYLSLNPTGVNNNDLNSDHTYRPEHCHWFDWSTGNCPNVMPPNCDPLVTTLPEELEYDFIPTPTLSGVHFYVAIDPARLVYDRSCQVDGLHTTVFPPAGTVGSTSVVPFGGATVPAAPPNQDPWGLGPAINPLYTDPRTDPNLEPLNNPLPLDGFELEQDILAVEAICAQRFIPDDAYVVYYANYPGAGGPIALPPELDVTNQPRGFWKKGAKRFCSQHWSYQTGCARHGGEDTAVTGTTPGSGFDFDRLIACLSLEDETVPTSPTAYENCECGVSAPPYVSIDAVRGVPEDYPDDVLDDMVYGLPSFLEIAEGLVAFESTPAIITKDIDQWYQDIAVWIEYGTNSGASGDSSVCGNPRVDHTVGAAASGTPPCCWICEIYDGALVLFMKEIEEVALRIEHQIYGATHVEPVADAWCVPAADPVDSPAVEIATFDSNGNGVRGDFEDLVACLDWNANDIVGGATIPPDAASTNGGWTPHHPGVAVVGNSLKFELCATDCWNYQGLCSDLPRSIIPYFDDDWPFIPMDMAVYNDFNDCYTGILNTGTPVTNGGVDCNECWLGNVTNNPLQEDCTMAPYFCDVVYATYLGDAKYGVVFGEFAGPFVYPTWSVGSSGTVYDTCPQNLVCTQNSPADVDSLVDCPGIDCLDPIVANRTCSVIDDTWCAGTPTTFNTYGCNTSCPTSCVVPMCPACIPCSTCSTTCDAACPACPAHPSCATTIPLACCTADCSGCCEAACPACPAHPSCATTTPLPCCTVQNCLGCACLAACDPGDCIDLNSCTNTATCMGASCAYTQRYDCDWTGDHILDGGTCLDPVFMRAIERGMILAQGSCAETRQNGFCSATYPCPPPPFDGIDGNCDNCYLGQNIPKAKGFIDLTREASEQSVNQINKMRKRVGFLNDRLTELTNMYNILARAYQEFSEYLNDVAQDFIKYYIDLATGDERALPYHVIYGWQGDPPDPTDPTSQGLWHIVRVDARTPGRCDAACASNQRSYRAFPRVRTYGKDWGMTRCYELVDERGVIKMRVSRYDQGRQSRDIYFADGETKIWNFRIINTRQLPVIDPNDFNMMENSCQDVAQPNNPNSYAGPGFLYGDAFMLWRYIRIGDDPSDPTLDNTLCWDYATKFLAKGVETEACMEYYYHYGMNKGMGMKFIQCLSF
ncbi:MAG: hypothetical protein K8S27_06080 [Candidatus Omnitrophica bacterium]|nr:hypothetical protein [Candidatus Omnitrophota bacterium]